MALVRQTGDKRVFAFDGASFRHIPGGKFAVAAYGTGWPSLVRDVADKNDAGHPFGNAKLPVYYPQGDPN